MSLSKSFSTAVSFLALLFFSPACGKKDILQTTNNQTVGKQRTAELIAAADRTELYFPLLAQKNVAVVANATSKVGSRHLLDTLLAAQMKVKKVFAPEHGFRGDGDAGEYLKDSRDPTTGLPIISLHGSKKKPDAADLQGIDLVVFDIQDVGVRFFTYLSTLHYVMEACAEQNISLLVLDRPNPNGHYIDGPILEKKYASFVGLHPVPVVYGMTIGEYAQMINGEGWLGKNKRCKLQVIDCQGYNRNIPVGLPIKPSPNLPNLRAVLLYPSLCLLEGTPISVGRGTDKPFQLLGHPDLTDATFQFVPQPNSGAKDPLLKGKNCRGFDYSQTSLDTLQRRGLDLDYVMTAYQNFPKKADFFLKNNYFDKLAGTDALRRQILRGTNTAQIRASWQPSLQIFKNIRAKYLRYP